MNRLLLLCLPCVLVPMLGCPSSDITQNDAGLTGKSDSGIVAKDAGFPPADAGFPEADAGFGAADAGFPEADAGFDGGFSDAGFSAPDAGFDGGLSDAGTATVAPSLFLFVNSTLARFEVQSAELAELGPTGFGPLGILSTIADTSSSGVVRALVDFTTAPTLATVDLCTGAVTRGLRIRINGNPAPVAEGMAMDDTGTAFISVKTTAVAGTITNAIARLDLATGEATVLGPVTTLQNDVDQLTFGDGVLYALDVNTNVGRAGIYSVNRTTGATTLIVETTDLLRRMVWDPSRHGLIGTTADTPDRQLVSIDLVSGALTPLAATYALSQQGGQLVDSLLLAPAPACARELLQNPGFERAEPVCGFPSGTREWGVDYSELSPAVLGVVPRNGRSMLRFVSADFDASSGVCGPVAGGLSSDVAQLVDVSRCEPATSIELRGYFDAEAGASPWTGTCELSTYTGTTTAFGVATPINTVRGMVAIDADPGTWQPCSVRLVIPAGATYVAAYLSAGAAPMTRFGDDASLRVTAGGCP